MQWLYADASINNMPLSSKQWRELITAALQSADIYLQTGDIEPQEYSASKLKFSASMVDISVSGATYQLCHDGNNAVALPAVSCFLA